MCYGNSGGASAECVPRNGAGAGKQISGISTSNQNEPYCGISWIDDVIQKRMPKGVARLAEARRRVGYADLVEPIPGVADLC